MKLLADDRLTRALRVLCVFFLYAVVASVALNAFMLRWGFRDGEQRFGFEQVLTYSADRPFAYRVLVPALANGLTQLTPAGLVQRVESVAAEVQGREVAPPREQSRAHEPLRRGLESLHERYDLDLDYPVQRLYTYFLLFLSLVLLQYTLRALAAQFFLLPRHVLDVVPAVALLFLPLTFQKGGFVYDFPDLLLMTLAILAIARRSWIVYYATFVLAILNKETAMLLLLAPWAVLRGQMSVWRLALTSLAQIAVGVPLLLFVRHLFSQNPGAGLEWHFWSNLEYFSDISSYLVTDDPYAPLIFFPVLFNIALLALVVVLVLHRWWEKPRSMRDLLVLYLIVLTPLFLANGYRNEVRVFYLLAPAYYVLALHTALSLYGSGIGRMITESDTERRSTS